MIRILIADDHGLIREGIRKVLKNHPDMTVMGEAGNCQEIFAQLERETPDVLILDISLPGRSGLDALGELRERYPRVQVLVLSMYPEERYAVRAIKAGAAGYVTKQSAAKELVNAIRKVQGGGRYISPTLAEQLANEIAAQTDRPLHEALSDRELEIARWLALGKTGTEIAAELSLSVNTVANHRARILKKMQMKNNAELIRYAIEHGLVNFEAL
ncbi:MAG: response regulator transcription factor [Verrucomicrobiota bacterium]